MQGQMDNSYVREKVTEDARVEERIFAQRMKKEGVPR
jgi:hypothetical protein